jgi:hypothetical protein
LPGSRKILTASFSGCSYSSGFVRTRKDAALACTVAWSIFRDRDLQRECMHSQARLHPLQSYPPANSGVLRGSVLIEGPRLPMQCSLRTEFMSVQTLARLRLQSDCKGAEISHRGGSSDYCCQL